MNGAHRSGASTRGYQRDQTIALMANSANHVRSRGSLANIGSLNGASRGRDRHGTKLHGDFETRLVRRNTSLNALVDCPSKAVIRKKLTIWMATSMLDNKPHILTSIVEPRYIPTRVHNLHRVLFNQNPSFGDAD